MTATRFSALIISVAMMLSACDGEQVAEEPTPIDLPDTAIGYFCGMTVVHHSGPKGQVFLKSQSEPIWFVSVRDTLAFTRMPDEAHRVRAVFVTDMGVAESWDQPGDASWRDAKTAWFVVGSTVKGSMGGSEVVPFTNKAEAEAFVKENGGQIERMNDIATEKLLGDGDAPAEMNM